MCMQCPHYGQPGRTKEHAMSSLAITWQNAGACNVLITDILTERTWTIPGEVCNEEFRRMAFFLIRQDLCQSWGHIGHISRGPPVCLNLCHATCEQLTTSSAFLLLPHGKKNSIQTGLVLTQQSVPLTEAFGNFNTFLKMAVLDFNKSLLLRPSASFLAWPCFCRHGLFYCWWLWFSIRHLHCPFSE